MTTAQGIFMQRLFLFLALTVGLAACSGNRAPTPLTNKPAPPPTFVAGNPKFADNDPVDWTGPVPWSYPIHGVDVARYQAGVDFARMRANGIRFAFIKATEGGDHTDPEFRTHWARAAAAGLPRGAYHFYYWCRPAAEQARWFFRHVPRDAAMLPPVLDVEWNHVSPTCRVRPPAEEVRAQMREFLRLTREHYGKLPIIYTTPDFFERNELWKINGYPFWLRSVAEPPAKVYPGQRWLFWQYTGTGRVPGAPGAIDLNVFHGEQEHWDAWLAANAPGAGSGS